MALIVDNYLKVLKNYAAFGSRTRRSEFWYFTLANVLVSIGLQIITAILRGIVGPVGAIVGGLVLVLFYLAILVPSISVAIRRLHDTGRSGWWILIALVPFIGGIALIVFYAMDSQPSANKWGPNPKEATVGVQPVYTIDSAT